MPKFSTKMNKNKQKKRSQQGVKKGGPRPRKVGGGMPPLAVLLNNPCGQIPRGLTATVGGGIVRVVRKIFTMHQTAGSNSGYLLWYPDFHCRGQGTNVKVSANVFAYEVPTGSVAVPPTSTMGPVFTGTPLFAGTVSTSGAGTAYDDPAYSILGSVFREAATLAACAKFRYLGTTAENRGAVGRIEQLDGTNFLTTDGSYMYGPAPSFLVAYAEDRQRPDMADLEVKWAPTNGVGTTFRGTGDQGSNNTLINTTDSFLELGVANTSATQFVAPNPSSHTAIGFVWTGLGSANGGDIEVELISVVELKVAVTSGLRETIAVVPTPEAFNSATRILDSTNPDWRTTMAHAGEYAANRLSAGIANIALAGAANYASRRNRNRGLM